MVSSPRTVPPRLLLILALAAPGLSVRAELLEFADGGRVVLPARIEGESVILDSPSGTWRFLRDDFRRIAPDPRPESEWPDRVAEARRGGVPDLFAAAWWALENGLTPESVALLREIHARDPQHQPTARMVAVLDRLAQPAADPDLGALSGRISPEMALLRGDQILLFHRQTPDGAADRIELLRRVLTTFYLNLTAYGMTLDPPPRRLPIVWYAEHDEYLATLRASGAGDLAATRGYFHPTLAVVFTFDGRSEPAVRREQRTIDAARREYRRLGDLIDAQPDRRRIRLGLPDEPADGFERTEAQERLDRLRRQLDRRQLLLDLDRIDREYAAAAHELIHSLVRASGLAPRHDTFPVWLHEGLAMQFEVVRGGRWAGVGRLNPHRLPYWDTSPQAPNLDAIIRDHGFGKGYDARTYARAWALVYYLRKREPAAFLALLDQLRNRSDRQAAPGDRAVEAMHALFGPGYSDLETRWRAYTDGLKSGREMP